METLLKVTVSPSASRNEVKAWQEERLKVRVHAPPEKGQANKELRRFLAKNLGIAPGQIEVRRGESSRKKTLAIRGLTKAETLARLSD